MASLIRNVLQKNLGPLDNCLDKYVKSANTLEKKFHWANAHVGLNDCFGTNTNDEAPAAQHWLSQS